MNIYLNEELIKEDYNSLSLPELLEEVKNDMEDEVLKQIFVNGVEINENYLQDDLIDKEDIESIKFVTQKTEVLIEETLNGANEYLPKLKEGVLETSDHFRGGEEDKANKKYEKVLKGIEWYTGVMTNITSIISDEELYVKSQKLIVNLNNSLNELMNAYSKNDIVLIADILEYEIVDFIDEFIEFNEVLISDFVNERSK